MGLFCNKETAQALAEVREDGEASMDKEFGRMKYQGDTSHRHFKVPTIEVAVRVQAPDGPPFEAKMEAGAQNGILLRPGVKVQVEYHADHHDRVKLLDDLPAILARNPQLQKPA